MIKANSSKSRITNLLKSERVIWVAILLGTMLSLPSIFSGYVADDHLLMQNTMSETIYPARSTTEYFNLVSTADEVSRMRERGVFQWWTPDEFRITFFKPLSSLLHALQFGLFPDSPWIMHLIVVLMYIGLIVVFATLLKTISGPGLVFGLGVILFAINDSHGYSAGWISSQNTLATCVLGYAAFYWYTLWDKRNNGIYLLGSSVLFVLSLGFSEGGLALFGLLLSYSLYLSKDSLNKRIYSLIPYVIIAIAYMTFYKVNGFGVKGSGIYINPGVNLIETAKAIFNNSSILAFSQLLSFPPVTMTISMFAWGGLFSLLMIAGFIYLYKDFFKENANARFYGSSIILTMIPFTLSQSQDRLLLWAGLGGAGLLAELYIWMKGQGKTTTGRKVVFNSLLITNLVFSFLFFIPSSFYYFMIENTSKMIEKSIAKDNTILVNAPMDVFFLYPPAQRTDGKWPEHFHVLYCGADSLKIRKIDENRIVASSEKGWFATPVERFSRSQAFPFTSGDSVVMELMTAKIISTSKDGRPLEVEFSFKNGLDSLIWLQWTKSGLVPFEFPDINNSKVIQATLF